MSESTLWIYDPHTMTVSDEYVYALMTTLERITQELGSHWSHLLEGRSESSPFDIPSLPPQGIIHARHALGEIVDDLVWLRSALVAFAHATAEQERARAVSWTEPAERALSLWVSLLAGVSTEGALGEDPVGHAARSLSGGIPRVHEVVVREIDTPTVMAQAPHSWGDRVARIPSTESPIRIERYLDDQGQWSSEVYIAGTHEWGLGDTPEPFDMESNIALIAGLPAASLVGVQIAMTRAGVQRGERVTFTGHSQGGVIAARLAESGRYRTTGLLVVGSPTGTLKVSGTYPALALRHSDDVVPRLGGSDQGSGFTTIERRSGSTPGDVAGAHVKSGYVDMARSLDSSPAASTLPEFPVNQGTAQVRSFSAHRVVD
jgi:hypothetical protein